MYETLFAEENDDLIAQEFETRNVIGAKYYPFYQLAIENKDSSRFRLIQDLVSILAINLSRKEKIKDYQLEEYLSYHLFRVSQMVVDHNDFALFKQEIADFSLMLPVSPPDEVQDRICGGLFIDVPFLLYRDQDFMKEFEKRRTQIEHVVKHESAKNFEAARTLEKNLEDYKSYLIEQVSRLHDADYVRSLREEESGQLQTLTRTSEEYAQRISVGIEEMKRQAYELYVTSQICRTFFLIGAYLLFKQKNDGLDSIVYIKELWSHTTPEDADSVCLNRPPITFNPLWLSYLLLYDGVGHDFRYDLLSFGDFHGVTEYVNRYFLLAIEKAKVSLSVPSTSELENLKSNNLILELGHLYQFIDDFSSKPFVENLLRYCDDLIQHAETFDRLLSSKSKDEEGQIRVITAKEKLGDLKNWIELKTKEFEGRKQEIIGLLPLDPSQIKTCKAKIVEAYHHASEIEEIVTIVNSIQETDRNVPFISIDQGHSLSRVPRDCLIKPSLVDCSAIWSEFGRYVAFSEMNYFIREVLKCKRQVEDLTIKDPNIVALYDKIDSVVSDLRKKGFNPSIIFVPMKYSSDPEVKKHVTYENGRAFLKVGTETKMRIVHSTRFKPFNDILILDKAAFAWQYKLEKDSSERLVVTVQEDETSKSTVHVLAKTTANLEIKNPKSLRILRIKEA